MRLLPLSILCGLASLSSAAPVTREQEWWSLLDFAPSDLATLRSTVDGGCLRDRLVAAGVPEKYASGASALSSVNPKDVVADMAALVDASEAFVRGVALDDAASSVRRCVGFGDCVAVVRHVASLCPGESEPTDETLDRVLSRDRAATWLLRAIVAGGATRPDRDARRSDVARALSAWLSGPLFASARGGAASSLSATTDAREALRAAMRSTQHLDAREESIADRTMDKIIAAAREFATAETLHLPPTMKATAVYAANGDAAATYRLLSYLKRSDLWKDVRRKFGFEEDEAVAMLRYASHEAVDDRAGLLDDAIDVLSLRALPSTLASEERDVFHRLLRADDRFVRMAGVMVAWLEGAELSGR